MDLREAGYFSRTHGTRGQLVLKTDLGLDLDQIKALFIEVAGSKAPHFVLSSSELPQGYLFALEEINTIDKAKLLLKKAVYVQPEVVLEEESDDDLIGYALIDETRGKLGIIEAISSQGAQDLMIVVYKGRELMLPLAEDLILRIDDEKKEVHYRAPEGLVEMFVGE